MRSTALLVVGFLIVASTLAFRQNPPAAPARPAGPLPVPEGKSVATIDLMTDEGVATCNAQWRYSDVKIIEVPSTGPGADRNTPGAAMTSYDIEPRAGEAGFDDSKWPVIAPKSLADRRGAAKICFNWYRIYLTMPAKVGDVDVTGATAVFTMTIDDYGEIWVNGALPRTLTPPNPNCVQGFNEPNRVTISQSVKAGETIQIAAFGMNGPISAAPGNYIFVREARVEFFR